MTHLPFRPIPKGSWVGTPHSDKEPSDMADKVRISASRLSVGHLRAEEHTSFEPIHFGAHSKHNESPGSEEKDHRALPTPCCIDLAHAHPRIRRSPCHSLHKVSLILWPQLELDRPPHACAPRLADPRAWLFRSRRRCGTLAAGPSAWLARSASQRVVPSRGTGAMQSLPVPSPASSRSRQKSGMP